MNICLISKEYPPETGFGGIGTYTYNLAQGLSKRGNSVTVITQALKKEKIYLDGKVKVYRIFDKKTPFKGFTRLMNILTFKGFGYYWHSYSVFQKIKQITKSGHPFDIIEGPLWDGECIAYDKSLNAPLIVRLQTPISKSREILNLKPFRVLEFIEKASLVKAVLIPAISKNIGAMIINHYKIPKKKIRLSYLGIDLPDIKKPVFNKNPNKLLYVGRLEKRKGTKEFIDALPEILSSNKDIKIDIVGKDIPQAPGGISYKKYFLKVLSKKLQPRVNFYGFVDSQKLKKFYRNCDVLIAPSRYESFGLIFLEAFAYGKPVIGTKVGGIPEIVEDGKTGLLIDPDNSSQISKAVLKIFGSNNLRRKLGENAFKKVRETFSVSQMVDRTLNIYNEAVKKFKTS